MITAWTKNLKTEEEKKKFELYVRGSGPLLDRLKELVNEGEESLDKAEVDPTSYDSPNWAYKQADRNGYRRCLQTFRKLLTLDQQKDK